MSRAEQIIIGDSLITWQDVTAVARHGATLTLSQNAWARIDNAQAIVQRIVTNGERAYGVNTGLGALCNVSLEGEQLSRLSRNTLLSHACGVGAALPDEQTRAIICAAIINYSQGKSGIHRQVVEALIALLNHRITPQVPSQGSVGYLTHMAHIGIALLGVGQVSYRGQVISALQALSEEGLSPVELGAKDGLCLVNGTPCMTGLSCLAIADVNRLMQWADVISAMTFEGLRGQLDAFDEEIIALKPHPGMQQVGRNLRGLLAGSEVLANSKGIRTQDALSIRSIPQVHGATRDQLTHATRQIETELNSATDNPLLLGIPDAYRVVSQANPHGQSVAMAADLLAIAMAELGSIAERRLDRLINPTVSGLPAFLVSQPGVNSGMMIVQYVAASLCAENRQLAQPAVIDNYVTSGLQEDHLSMGTSAALKLHKVLENVTQILAIEYLLAAQAFEFFKGPRFGVGTEVAWRLLRERVPAYDEDRWLAPDIASSVTLLKNEESLETVFQVCRDYAQMHNDNNTRHSRSPSATSAEQAGASSRLTTDINEGVAAS
jgi:histidine ammonia-lyase